ncbi:MAG: exo-alpha-sialidase [Armatimonadetes bacterium]|nr:exo-alpha-sialidase [Armatimonadota bacterium]
MALLACVLGADPGITWDQATLRCVQAGATYGRLTRLADSGVLCCFEMRGRCYTRRSDDDGRTFAAPVPAALCAHGAAANPELLPLGGGRVLLFYNERPRDGEHPFTIRACASGDGGRSWSDSTLVFAAGTRFEEGCWEPAAVRCADGTIRLFFANEAPYRTSAEQEISEVASTDDGRTWSAPRRVSFRPGHRDGMPVPVLRPDGALWLAIEDNGYRGAFKPMLVDPANGDRWPVAPGLAPDVYAGAPYVVGLPDGRLVVSCQSADGLAQAQMAVWLSDATGRAFGAASRPFALDAGVRGYWNSLWLRDARTVVALSGTRVGEVAGLWAIDGRVSE